MDWPRFYASALCAIWRMRNEWVFNQAPHSAARIWGLMKALGMAHLAVDGAMGPPLRDIQGHHPGVFDCNRTSTANLRWVAPEPGWMKANVDGAVSFELHASCGGVIRDSAGRWFKGFSRNLGQLDSANVLFTELVAILTTTEMLMGLDLPQVIVESDAMEAIQFINSTDVVGHRYGHLVVKILHLQAAHGALVFQHGAREYNFLADHLAKLGLSLPFGEHWFDSPFGECHPILLRDSSPPHLSGGFDPP